ncbi:transmembrane protein 223 [Synchiropus splendidus]|uniref:transmembrane protein 223 n=1 Tax=Synchiropus splendidus TaxID=270530 RepID=UPI00237E483E|nr:transmembrane protein 223 [Synchiropus splendidus]
MGLELLCVPLRLYFRQSQLGHISQKVLLTVRTSTRNIGTSRPVHLQRNAAGPSSEVFGQLAARRCISTAVQKDITLFQHDRSGFFRLLAIFCGGQFLFWTYLAHFAYTGLRDTGRSSEKSEAKSRTSTALAGIWSFDMNLGSSAWRYGFTLGCLAIGAGICGLGVLFCRRSVNQVILHRGGKLVTITTQSPRGAGKGRKISVPLSEVACHAHREETTSFIPLKVRGHKFYYLLDKEGTVNNVRLFDNTVGAYRPF